jgi:hypothetical protein
MMRFANRMINLIIMTHENRKDFFMRKIDEAK